MKFLDCLHLAVLLEHIRYLLNYCSVHIHNSSSGLGNKSGTRYTKKKMLPAICFFQSIESESAA